MLVENNQYNTLSIRYKINTIEQNQKKGLKLKRV